MAPSNVARLYFALQAVKGAPAAAPQYAVDFSGGTGPVLNRTIGDRPLTGLGRDPGNSFIQKLEASGSFSMPVFAKTSAFFAYAALGTKGVTGAGPYVHALSPANSQPYLTIWRSLFDGIYERIDDCKVTSLGYTWEAGGDLMCEISVVGTTVTPLASIPAGSTYDGGEPLRVPDMVYDVDGAEVDTITGGSLTIETPHEGVQTRLITPSYVLESGPRVITASFNELYINPDRYNLINYNDTTPAGGAASTSIYDGEVILTFGDPTAGPGLVFDIPFFAFSSIELAPAADAGVLMQTVGGQAWRDPATGNGPVLTMEATNSIASYTAV